MVETTMVEQRRERENLRRHHSAQKRLEEKIAVTIVQTGSKT
jgi:hypothetical protein